ncbi:MAG: ABC transporter ATP-binding protein [Phycisphaerales bacterium]
MLEVRSVSKSYGSFRAVREVSFDARPGQVTGLLGPNGAGKTTLIRMIAAYLTPSAGAIRVAGHDTVDASGAARAAIGYLPESAPLYPEMTVEGYLRYRAGLFGLGRSAGHAAVERTIERCWLTEMRRRRIGSLSKGYRQRTGLGAALLHDPPVVLLDEPTSGLDPTQILAMRGLIRDLGREKTVLVSSHILGEVEQTCDRVVIIARGRLRAQGRPQELIAAGMPAQGCRVGFAKGTDMAEARALLQGLSCVGVCRATGSGQDASADDGGVWFEIEGAAGTSDDVCEVVGRAAMARGLVVRQLSSNRPTLEDVFLRVVECADDDGVGVRASSGS